MALLPQLWKTHKDQIIMGLGQEVLKRAICRIVLLHCRESCLLQTVLPWCGTLFRVPCNKSLLVHPSKNFIWTNSTNWEANAGSTKLRKMQTHQSVLYHKKREVLRITTLPCLQVFFSLIIKTYPKVRGTLKSLPKIVSKRSHDEEFVQEIKAPKPQSLLLPA